MLDLPQTQPARRVLLRIRRHLDPVAGRGTSGGPSVHSHHSGIAVGDRGAERGQHDPPGGREHLDLRWQAGPDSRGGRHRAQAARIGARANADRRGPLGWCAAPMLPPKGGGSRLQLPRDPALHLGQQIVAAPASRAGPAPALLGRCEHAAQQDEMLAVSRRGQLPDGVGSAAASRERLERDPGRCGDASGSPGGAPFPPCVDVGLHGLADMADEAHQIRAVDRRIGESSPRAIPVRVEPAAAHPVDAAAPARGGQRARARAAGPPPRAAAAPSSSGSRGDMQAGRRRSVVRRLQRVGLLDRAVGLDDHHPAMAPGPPSRLRTSRPEAGA